MSNEQKQPESKLYSCAYKIVAFCVLVSIWGILGLVYRHVDQTLDKIDTLDTPAIRRLLVISIIAFIVVFLMFVWEDRREWGCALIFAILAVAVIWIVSFFVFPLIQRLLEWIEHG